MHKLNFEFKRSIILLFFIITAKLLANNGTPYSFIRLNASDGLVNNQVTCIYKDSKGFIWIGTSAGLSRFDGNSFVNYTHNDKDSTSIIDNYITEILEDKSGLLWIGTRSSYTIFNPQKEIFINNISPVLKQYGITSSVSRIYIDKNKKLWFRPNGKNRFYTFDNDKRELINPFKSSIPGSISLSDFFHDGKNFYYLYSNGIIECFDGENYRPLFKETFISESVNSEYFNAFLFVDAEKDIWVYGNNDGIYYYQTSRKQWSHFTTNSHELKLSSNLIKKVVQDEKGLIWIGTDHGGIDIICKFDKNLTTIFNKAEDLKSLSQNSITDIFIDNNNIVWIGTYKRGVCYYHESIHKFPHYYSILSDKNSLPFSDVNCFAEDKKGNLWIGTNGGGLIYYERKNQKYKVYKNLVNNPNSLSNNVVVSLLVDKDGLLWIGTYTGGLNAYDGNKFTRYSVSKKNGLTNDNIWTITQDNKSRIWIGTLGGGIVLFDKSKKMFLQVPNQGNIQVPSLFINHIYKMRNGNMFIGTGYGIVFYDIEENRYRYHPFENRNTPLSISNFNVNWVFEDSRNLLWIASREGLTLIDPYSDYIKIFRKEDGLPRDIMNCIQEDEFHSIWVSKSTGLSQIIVGPEKDVRKYNFPIFNYTEADGIQGQEFNANSSFKTINGEMIFGGPNGFNLFQTKEIKYNKKLPEVIFTDFQIFNKSIKAGEKINGSVILENSITYTSEIEIKHSMNVFSIEFAALNSYIPGKQKYKYLLEGFDKEWIEVGGNSGKVVYTNLNAGTYKFKVKACNNDGLWNNNFSELTITILPPIYLSPVAYFIYLILVIGIFFYFRYSTLKRARFKFRMEQEQLAAKRNHELDEIKLRFLTNVSHEFRTPLTLILTPLEKLLKSIKESGERKLLETINRNAHSLLDLVNQLLDFRKLDLYGLKYQASYGDLIPFLKEVCGNFSDSFQRKDLGFEFKSPLKQFYFEFDTEKLKRVMMNLISNALKFTPQGGNISVSVEFEKSNGDNKQQIIIKVKDTGVGILEEDIDKIFDRFYQSQNNISLGITGSGIGLNLAKEMILLHGGTISVTSKSGNGSEFTIILPVKTSETVHLEKFEKGNIKSQDLSLIRTQPEKTDKPTILLIEDNLDFRIFMKESLEEKYIVYEAADGTEGYDIVHKVIPDLVISDVMMPHMDGLELCRKLKNDIRTSHIPLILLTARTADEDKIKGLEIGADDYITKPFNMDLLLLRIQNLMEKRKEIQKKFQKNIDISPTEIEIPSMDEKLIKKAVLLVSTNIAEAEFSVEDLSRELGMSRVYLYKKLLAITGKTPVEFIRIIRLKRGLKLLEKSQMSISEIAYAVGFNSPRYFSKYFKDEYGLLPKDYILKHRKNTIDKIDIV